LSSPPPARPLIFGELLFDCFPDGRRVIGGAPFNVAWHLRGFGRDPLLISRIGRDDAAEEALRILAGWDLDTTGLQRDPDRPTGQVTVTLHDGVPTFTIPPGQAFDSCEPAPALRVVQETSIGLVYHGTLALRSPGNARIVGELIAAAGAPVFLDVNVRRPWWNPELATVLMQRATWLKASVEELTELGVAGEAPGAAAETLVRRHGLSAVIVTGGPAGAWYADSSGSRHVPAVPVTSIADTVGAGDAFSAVCIHGLLARWSPTTILSRAAAFAAEICRRPGAVGNDHELYTRLQGGWRSWERPQNTTG